MTRAERLLQIVGDIGDNKRNVRDLWDIRKSLVPFVGAGMSMEFSYPSWGQLLETLCPSGDDAMRDQVKTLLKHSKYEDAASVVFEGVSFREQKTKIAELLGEKHLKLPIAGAVSILPRLAQGCVITTNLDHVLEKAFQEAGRPFATVLSGAQIFSSSAALQQRKRFLIKIHGDYDDPENWVLTLAQYKAVYEKQDADLPRVLTQALTGNVVLFLGCSLQTDRTMQVLERVTKQHRVDHFALLAETENRGDRLEQLSDWRIRPIFFPKGQYGKIEEFLASLAGVKQAGGLAAPAKPKRVRATPVDIRPIAAEIRMIRNFDTFLALNTEEKKEDSYGLHNGSRGRAVDLEALYREFAMVEGSPVWSEVDGAIQRVRVMEDAGHPGGLATGDERVIREYTAMLRRSGRVLDLAFAIAAVLGRAFPNATLEQPLRVIAMELGLRRATPIADKEARLGRIFDEIVDRSPAILDAFREPGAAENWLPEGHGAMQEFLFKLSDKAAPGILLYQVDAMVATYDVAKAWEDSLKCFSRRIVNGVLDCPADLNGLVCARHGDHVPRIFGPTRATSLTMWGYTITDLAYRRGGERWLLVGVLAEMGFRKEAIQKLSGTDPLPMGVGQWREAIGKRVGAEELERVLIVCSSDWTLLLGWEQAPTVAALTVNWYSWPHVASVILDYLPHFDYIFFEERGTHGVELFGFGPDQVESGISEFYSALPDERKAAFRSIPAFVLSPKDPQAQYTPALPRIFRPAGLDSLMEEARARVAEGKTTWDMVLDPAVPPAV